MKKTLSAAMLGIALAAAGPALAGFPLKPPTQTTPPATTTTATPATPAAPAAAQPAQPAGMPPECMQRMKAHAEKMKQELGLSEAQAAALRTEMERHHGAMLQARAEHKAAVAKILTPEQQAKVDSKRGEMRHKMMERCAMDDDDGEGKAEHEKGGRGKKKH